MEESMSIVAYCFKFVNSIFPALEKNKKNRGKRQKLIVNFVQKIYDFFLYIAKTTCYHKIVIYLIALRQKESDRKQVVLCPKAG